jgi:hypothetical protein
MAKHYSVNQNSEEWEALKLAKFSASCFHEAMAERSTATYKNLIKRIAYEKLTGEHPEFFKSDYMDRGHIEEPDAREKYEILTFSTIKDGGFFELNEWVGASPDGVIDGVNGGIEIKSPAYSTMMDYLKHKKLPSVYKWQVYGQMWVCGFDFVDFVAYHPKLPFLIVRVDRDELIIKELADRVNSAIVEVKDWVKLIKSIK